MFSADSGGCCDEVRCVVQSPGRDAVDPLPAAAGLSAEAVRSEAVKGLLVRALGPAADEIGTALARWTSFRVGNVERIALATTRLADKRGRSGSAPPRVAHRILGDGSWNDDSVMIEYLSGVLASSLTPAGRDDRAVVWSGLSPGCRRFRSVPTTCCIGSGPCCYGLAHP
jgi:hypothetical protein